MKKKNLLIIKEDNMDNKIILAKSCGLTQKINICLKAMKNNYKLVEDSNSNSNSNNSNKNKPDIIQLNVYEEANIKRKR